MTLKEICDMVLEIEEGLMYGSISFEYDNLMCAMKPGHPMEILDEILANIFWDVQAGKQPSQAALKKTLSLFKSFKGSFKVKEMKKPIDALEEYIYPSKLMTFPILIGEGNESYVEYAVPGKEIPKLIKAQEEGYELSEAPGLIRFYGKLLKAAKQKLIEDIDLTGGDIDIDELEYIVDYPEDMEEEENE